MIVNHPFKRALLVGWSLTVGCDIETDGEHESRLRAYVCALGAVVDLYVCGKKQFMLARELLGPAVWARARTIEIRGVNYISGRYERMLEAAHLLSTIQNEGLQHRG